MITTLRLDRTKEAIARYDAAKELIDAEYAKRPGRKLGDWMEKLDAEAAAVREAFYAETASVNTPETCRTIPISALRELAQRSRS